LSIHILPLHQGFHLPDLKIGLDLGALTEGTVVVSHAHADHMPKNRHMRVVCTPPTAALLRERGFSGDITELPFFSPMQTERARITLYPAGHILGSAMTFIESDAGTLLYTGDCKNPASPVSEGFHPPERADILITEATFGLPIYKWRDHEDLFARIRQYAADVLEEGDIPAFYCYTLGKTQEVLHALAPLGITTQVHGSAYALCQIYEDFGFPLGSYERFDRKTVAGKALICPHGAIDLPRMRPALVSGWATLEARSAQTGADARIPLSDHIDYFELLDWIGRLRPGKVYITHTSDPSVMRHALDRMGIANAALGAGRTED
jgi:putative mRNA 3-end processing factor